MRILCLALAGMVLSAGASGQPAKRAAGAKPAAKKAAGETLDKKKVEEYVRHLLLWGPQINVVVADPVAGPMPGYSELKVTGSYQKVSVDELFYLSADGKKLVRGAVYDMAENPFAKDLARIKTDLQPSIGTPGAQVVLAVYSDFQCPYCREEAKMLRDNLLKAYPKEVRLYFKDFPLDPIHPWARPASIAGRCVFRQKPQAFWEFHDWIFDKQAEMTAENLKSKVVAWAGEKQLDGVQFSRCLDAKETEPEIDRNVTEGRALKVDSTPTLFVNGRKVAAGIGWPQLKAIIDFELDYNKRTGFTPESCCELKLPIPGAK